MDFIKKKQNEFHRLQFTTLISVVIATIILAAIRGHVTQQLILWICIYNICGIGFGYILSYGAQ